MIRLRDSKSTLDDKWRKKNAQIVAVIIRVPMVPVPVLVETENQGLADADAVVEAAVAEITVAEITAAEITVVTPIGSQPISRVMHR
jgi:hypothetical protein